MKVLVGMLVVKPTLFVAKEIGICTSQRKTKMPTLKLNRHELEIYHDPDGTKIWFDLVPSKDIVMFLNFADICIDQVKITDIIVFDYLEDQICTFNCNVSYHEGDLTLSW
jgi:hypothetical protein